jgi:hypothetical protein
MKKHIPIAVTLPVLLFLHGILIGQSISFKKFPLDNQIYQRSLSNNKATVSIEGRAPKALGLDLFEARIYSGATIIQAAQTNITFDNTDGADFTIKFTLPARRTNHRVELWARRKQPATQWQLIKFAENIVAGDIYIINGQSNAQALAAPAPEDIDPFTRSYFEPYLWGPLNLSFPGLWGARLAKRLSDHADMPIAIFNQAVGALPIRTYLSNGATPTPGSNYGDLMKRLDASGTEHRIRAAFWFHGEADAWLPSAAEYKKDLEKLVAEWQEDYKIEHAFVFQKRYQSCGSPYPYVLEAQRQVAVTAPDISIMSTTNARHDSCHFYYEGGYQVLGDRMFELVANRLYGATFKDTEAPDAEVAWLENAQELVIKVRNTDKLQHIGQPWSDFRTEGKQVAITNGSVDGQLIRLRLAASANGVTGVSYLPHPGSAPHWITNTKGVGLLGFYSIPLGSRPVVATSEEESDGLIHARPNPVRETLWLDLPADIAPLRRALIADVSGVIIARFDAADLAVNSAVLEWPVGHLHAGAYFVLLETEDGKTIRSKFCKF